MAFSASHLPRLAATLRYIYFLIIDRLSSLISHNFDATIRDAWFATTYPQDKVSRFRL